MTWTTTDTRPFFNVPSLVIIGLALSVALAGCANSNGANASYDAGPSAEDITWADGANRPPSPKTLLALSQLMISQGRFDQAQFTLARIIVEHPEFMAAYVELAELNLQLRRIHTAQEVLERGLAISPHDPVLLNNLGMCWFFRKDFDQAADQFLLAVASGPDNARYRANLALTLGMAGRYEECLAAYLQVLRSGDAHYNLAVICDARDDTQRAEVEYARAAELNRPVAPPPVPGEDQPNSDEHPAPDDHPTPHEHPAPDDRSGDNGQLAPTAELTVNEEPTPIAQPMAPEPLHPVTEMIADEPAAHADFLAADRLPAPTAGPAVVREQAPGPRPVVHVRATLIQPSVPDELPTPLAQPVVDEPLLTNESPAAEPAADMELAPVEQLQTDQQADQLAERDQPFAERQANTVLTPSARPQAHRQAEHDQPAAQEPTADELPAAPEQSVVDELSVPADQPQADQPQVDQQAEADQQPAEESVVTYRLLLPDHRLAAIRN